MYWLSVVAVVHVRGAGVLACVRGVSAVPGLEFRI